MLPGRGDGDDGHNERRRKTLTRGLVRRVAGGAPKSRQLIKPK